MPSADEIIRLLQMEPHPEGGHYRETFRDPKTLSGRSVGTAIYYLLREGELSRWHRVDAAEIWHFYAGDVLELRIAPENSGPETHLLGNVLEAGERPQITVSAGHWQSARSLGAWSLVGCTVAPGFEFSGFEMAPENWVPGQPE